MSQQYTGKEMEMLYGQHSNLRALALQLAVHIMYPIANNSLYSAEIAAKYTQQVAEEFYKWLTSQSPQD